MIKPEDDDRNDHNNDHDDNDEPDPDNIKLTHTFCAYCGEKVLCS